MPKEAFYFSHDSNARNDEKIVLLRMKHGWEGYGLFWAIIERLRECSDYMSVCDYNLIAYDLRVDSAKVKSIICDFGLFAFTEDGKCFYSNSLMERMKIKEEKSSKAQNAALIRWELERKKSERNANAMQTHSDGNAIKEKKGKEIKEIKENSLSPAPHPDYLKFQDWIKANAPRVAKMEKPITEKEFMKLKDEFGHQVMMDYLTRMENYKPLLKNSTSANLTLRKWIAGDKAKKQQSDLPIYKQGMVR